MKLSQATQKGESIVYRNTHDNSAIVASGTERLTISEVDLRQYAPFNRLSINNQSNEQVTITLDEDPNRIWEVPPRGQLDLRELFYQNPLITNSSSTTTISAGAIRIEVIKVVL